MSTAELTQAAALASEQVVETAKGPSKTPAPTATGNAQVTILKHCLGSIMDQHGDVGPTIIDLAARNVSDSTIATALFEAVFYDEEGNIIDTARHIEIDWQPDTSRGMDITSSLSKFDRDKIKSYHLTLVRTSTADVEKVQLRRHELTTTETGEEEATGIVKNISQVKTDAAVVAIFYDDRKDNIGTRVLVLRDMEPSAIREFRIQFKPQAGDVVASCTINVGEVVA